MSETTEPTIAICRAEGINRVEQDWYPGSLGCTAKSSDIARAVAIAHGQYCRCAGGDGGLHSTRVEGVAILFHIAKTRLLSGPARKMRQASIGEARHDHLASAPPGEELKQHCDADAGIRHGNAMPGFVVCGQPVFEALNQRPVIGQTSDLARLLQQPEEIVGLRRRQLADWPRALEQG